jgi:hypothetical protein
MAVNKMKNMKAKREESSMLWNSRVLNQHARKSTKRTLKESS